MLGTWDKIVENMRKKELIKQLQNREPLLANAVSHMVEYIYSRPLPCGISKQSTDQSCERLSAERLCRWGRQHVREEPRTSTYRFAEHHYCRHPCIQDVLDHIAYDREYYMPERGHEMHR